MLLLLAQASDVLLVWLHVLGLGIIINRWLRLHSLWLGLTFGPWLVCSLLFFTEFFFGLGRLHGLLPFTSAACFYFIWQYFHSWGDDRDRSSPTASLIPYWWFCAIFFYAFSWRYAFPDLDGASERLADFSYICAYMRGDTLPAPDLWFPPHLSVQYYSFQYYAAALLGRLLGLDPGTTYQFGFSTLVGLAGSAAAGVAQTLLETFTKSTELSWKSLFVPLAWIWGGTGVTGMTSHLTSNANPSADMRFIGTSPLDIAPWGTWLATFSKGYSFLELPGEPFSYSIYLGDYHPPLAGFYLLMVSLLGFALYHQRSKPLYLVVPGACLSWSLIADPWNLPLEVVALAAWMAYNYRSLFRQAHALLLFLGGLGGYLSIYPYFRLFAGASESYNTKLAPVIWTQKENDHTPALLFLLFHLPSLGLCMAALLLGSRPTRMLAWLGLGLLAFSEFFYIDDIYSGQYERFNTTLKWWPWISAFILSTLGIRLLTSSAWGILAALLFLGYPLLYRYELYSVWMNDPKPHWGQLSGDAYLIDDKTRGLMQDLEAAPPGITVEDPEGEAFCNHSAFTLFAGKTCFLGWVSHEQLWHGYTPELQYRYDQIKLLYSGNLPNAGEWLEAQNVRYVLWFKAIDLESNWDKIDKALQASYEWHESYFNQVHCGYWMLRQPKP